MKQLLLGFFMITSLFLLAQKDIDPEIIKQDRLDEMVSNELVRYKISLPNSLKLKNIAAHMLSDYYIVRQRAFANGIEIEDKDIVVALNNKNGDLVMSGHSLEGLNGFKETKAAVTNERASSIAQKTFESKYCKANIFEVKLVYKELEEQFVLTYKISINGSDCVGYSIYYVDASTGTLVESIDKSFSASKIESNRSSKNQASQPAFSGPPLACTPTANLNLPDPTGSIFTYSGVDSYPLGITNYLGAYIPNAGNTGVIPTSIAYYLDPGTTYAQLQSLGVECISTYTFPNTEDRYRTTFTYIYLKEFLEYYNQFTTISPVKFNANAPDTGPNAYYSPINGIQYTVGAFSAMGSDLFHVAGGGADYLLTILNNNALNTEVRGGLLDYLAQSFEWQYASSTNPSCFDYGGVEYLTKRYTDANSCSDNDRNYTQQEYLSSCLIKLREKFSNQRIDKLVVLTINMLTAADNDNQKVAEKLFSVANTMMTSEFSCYELVDMRKIIFNYFDYCYPSLDLDDVIINDFWIKDNAGDTEGKEPYLFGNAWESPDIWNTIGNVVMDPEYNQPNVMNVRITNIGAGNCIPQKLMLYWSVNLTNQAWPESWSTPPTSSFLGEAVIPQIAPGQTIVVQVPWTAPNPMDLGGESIHFCVLARIVDQADGVVRALAYLDKLEYTGPWSTNKNVKYFNGISWKNMVLKKFSGAVISNNDEMVTDGVLLFLAGPSPLGSNPVDPTSSANPSIVDFDINVTPQANGETNLNPTGLAENLRDPLFFEKLDVFIKPLDGLITALQNCDGPCFPPGTYEIDQDGFYKILSHDFKFNKVVLDENKLYKIRVKVKPKRNYDKCSFSIIQRSDNDKIFGGETYTFLKDGLNPRSIGYSLDNKLSIFPNPAKSIVKLRIENASKISKIELVDISGRISKHIIPEINLFEYDIDVSSLDNAVYFINVVFENNEQSTIQFVKE